MLTPTTPLEYVKGIGAERSRLLKTVLELKTVGDLLQFYPLRYTDRTRFYKIHELSADLGEVQLQGQLLQVEEVGTGRSARLVATFSDGTPQMELVWFRYSKWLKAQLPVGVPVVIFGRVNFFNHKFSMPHPEVELLEKAAGSAVLEPVYPGSEKLQKRGITNRFFINTLRHILSFLPSLMPENLPAEVIRTHTLMDRAQAVFYKHFPPNMAILQQAECRLKFEESFFFQMGFGLKKLHHQVQSRGNANPIVGDYFTNFYNNDLPFELTTAQKRVLREIRQDMKRPIQMNRLLQGDVGSGKTMVALLSMLLAADNGFQSVLMAPTEILAQQHYAGISALIQNTGLKISLLTGSTGVRERRMIHQGLADGSLNILVGTHAVLEDVIQFDNLGLAIIDEQHRFGVAQRAKLWAKNKLPPDILVMTATPIPRTLAMSFYSDLEVSVIDELPVGRKSIITAHRKEEDRTSVYEFCRDEIRKGRQIYFVYPLIEESSVLDYRNLQDGFDHLKQYFSEYRLVMLHGRMTPAEKEAAMAEFASGKCEIMVATTVIEVGVNVPNASVMVIESAERFGLSQLHQLRGRVGRGAEQSYCILMTGEKLGKDSRKRIRTMCETNDGFRISEVDMQLRGPGDILGTQQSGVLDFKVLDLVQDEELIRSSKQAVEDLLKKDPTLSTPANRMVREYYVTHYRGRNKWSKIS